MISFHSLEDRIVKRFMAREARGDEAYAGLPNIPPHARPRLTLVGELVRPSPRKSTRNPRARSARLRIARANRGRAGGMKSQLLELARACCCLPRSVTASGVWVVGAKHRARQLFIELEELNREQDRLQIDWGRLQIEQSTWATHPRIEALARERLHLTEPCDEQLVVVEAAQREK